MSARAFLPERWRAHSSVQVYADTKLYTLIHLQGDVNQAISMVSYYASSSEPAQIRGKTVYIQYSNRHEIVNNQSPGEVPGNVLFLGHL